MVCCRNEDWQNGNPLCSTTERVADFASAPHWLRLMRPMTQTYMLSCDPKRPVVWFEEASKQL
jgi:hypothetical protein